MRRPVLAALLVTFLALPLTAAIPSVVQELDSGTRFVLVTVSHTPQNFAVTYAYSTVDGTATAADNDYIPTSGVITFPAGSGGTQTIEVGIVGDTKFEADEVFTLEITNVPDGPYEFTIQNDDTPRIEVGPAAPVVEGNIGTTAVTFPVRLIPAANVPVTGRYMTIGGSATEGQDFLPASGDITFAPGETEKTISVTVLGDTVVEGDEEFQLSVIVGNANYLTFGRIINDDQVAFTINNSSVREGNTGITPMTFEVTLSAAPGVQVLIGVTTENITATFDDYFPLGTSVIFNPGETRKSFAVEVIGDTLFENDETFAVIATPNGFPNVAPVRVTGTIIDDDPAPPSTITIVSGNNQSGILGLQLAQPLVVEVRDARGQPAAGVAVQWRVTRGAAALTPATSNTDAQGRTSTRVTLNSVGTIEIEASVAGLTPVKFTVGSITALEVRAEGPVAVPVARTLDQICARNEETFATVCRTLTLLPDELLTPTLERIAPQTSGAQARISSEFVSSVTSDIRNRLSNLRAGADRVSVQGISLFHKRRAIPVATIASAFLPQATDAGAPDDDYSGWSAFISGTVGDGEREGGDGLLGFDLETRGVMLGVDRLVGQSSIVGASLNWMGMDSELDDNAGAVDATGYALSLYASRAGLFGGGSPGRAYDGVHLDGSVTFGRNTYDSEHVVDIRGLSPATATSENDGDVFALSAGGGIEAHRGRTDFDFTLAGTWSRTEIDDLTESGSGPLILFVQGHEVESLTATLGMNVRSAFAVPFGTLLPSFRAELVHEFEADARLVTARFIRDTLGTSFTVPVDRPDENYGKLAAGLQAEFPYGWSALVEVTQDVARSDLKFTNLQFNLRKAF